MDKKDEEILVEVLGGNLINSVTGEIIISHDEIVEGTGKGIQFIESGKGELAVGISFPSTMKVPVDYLKDVDEYKFTTSAIYKQMDVCDKMYKYESIIGSAVDTLVDLSNTPIVAQDLRDKKAQKILEHFSKNLNKKLQTSSTGLGAFIEQGMSQYLVFGNAFPYKSWRKVDVDGEKYNLPNITYMNPKNIQIDEDRIAVGEEKIYISMKPRTLNRIKKNGGKELAIIKGASKEDLKAGKIPLSPDNVTHIKRKARDWEGWGIPYLVRAFGPVSSKKRLRKLDDTTTEGLINYLTIFKIGSSNEKSPYHKVSLARLTAFSNLIRNPTASTTLVWPHDLEVITTGPEGKVLDFKEKYNEVDRDILQALGIVGGLFDTKNIDEEAILVLIETLESMREVFITYITDLYNEILEKNGIDIEDFKVRFNNIKLSDILQKLKSMLLSFYDRGLLSFETAITVGGHDFAQEVKRKKNEKKYKEEGLFDVPNLPFSADNNDGKTPMQQRDDGRPTDKIRTEKPKIDNDVKLEKPEKNIGMTKADTAFIDGYRRGIENKYDKLRDKILKSIEDNNAFIEDEITLIISAGFLELRQYTSKALKIAYDVFNEDLEVDEKDFMYQRLEGWNTTHLTKFKESISTTINKGYDVLEGADVDLLIPLVLTTFEKERYRLNMYAEEGYVKARMAGIIETQARSGNVGGFWETAGDDRVCPACEGKDGNWYKNEELLDLFPTHPHCRCNVLWTANNPILDDPGTNNTPVRTAPNNPNKPL